MHNSETRFFFFFVVVVVVVVVVVCARTKYSVFKNYF